MYDNIASLRFQKGHNNEVLALSMVSSEGETMEFRTSVPAEGRVEDWMTAVLEEMRRTNRLITKEALFYYGVDGKTRYVCCSVVSDACINLKPLLTIFNVLQTSLWLFWTWISSDNILKSKQQLEQDKEFIAFL